MQCPIDQTVLVITERNSIEIDYCPACRGVWLDRGELDKLIAGGASTATPQQSAADQDNHTDQTQDYSSESRRNNREPERGSFLADLFDF